MECEVLKRQLIRAGLGDTVVLKGGVAEVAGLSGNVHKLTWLLYGPDGSPRSAAEYAKLAKDFHDAGIGNVGARRKRFYDATRAFVERPSHGYSTAAPAPGDFEDFFAYCRQHPEAPIIVHCCGPLTLLKDLSQHWDLRRRVVRIGGMLTSYDGSLNLLGRNFNEAVAPKLTEDIFGYDGRKLYTTFPNADQIWTPSETCKKPELSFVPFEGEVQRKGVNRLQPLLVISDDGKDLDDELAKVLLSELTRRGLVTCPGFIANLSPARKRARLAKGTLTVLGMGGIPVGVGSDMIDGKESAYEFDVPYMASEGQVHRDGVKLFAETLATLGGSCTLVCLS